MKAAVIHDFGGIESITIEEVPQPKPLENEVLIQIHAAGVNPVDWKITDGHFKGRMGHSFPLILGWDAAGTVSQVGSEVKNVKVGDAVYAYCRKEKLCDGAYAEFICLPSTSVAHKPKSLPFEQAASIPLAALTAWQSLHEKAHLKKGETVLIHAGAGGVGGFALTFAKLIGAKVITTASGSRTDYVKDRGAGAVIDYTKENFVDVIRKQYSEGIDVVFDTVGGETLEESYKVLKKGGRLVTIAGSIDPSKAAAYQINGDFHFVHPSGEQLDAIAQLIDAELLKAPDIETLPFKEVKKALKQNKERHTQGKIVLSIK